MNNSTMRAHAAQFAHRLQAEGGKDVSDQVRLAWRLVDGRVPSEADVQQSVEFIREQTAYYQTHPTPLESRVGTVEKIPADPALLGLTALCHALMSSNALLYVD